MCDPRHADKFSRVVNDVHHALVSDTNAPLIFVALQFFASCGPRSVCERKNLTVYAMEQRIVQGIQFPLCRLLDFESVFSHVRGCASPG